jgi:uncharacterized protein YggU (UPF0235/DUF167 family)
MPNTTLLRSSMPRPKADLPDPAALWDLVAGDQLRLRVTPGARTEAISVEEGRVLVKVRAKPSDGAANTAVVKLVARSWGRDVTLSDCARRDFA